MGESCRYIHTHKYLNSRIGGEANLCITDEAALTDTLIHLACLQLDVSFIMVVCGENVAVVRVATGTNWQFGPLAIGAKG